VDSELEKSPLWGVLVEAVHYLPTYKSHKSYVKETILPQKPGVAAEELSDRLGIPLGEAMVILEELKAEKPKAD
jgi:hypothetical protein